MMLSRTPDNEIFQNDVVMYYNNLERSLKASMINVLRKEFDDCRTDSKAIAIVIAAKTMGLDALSDEMHADYRRKIENPHPTPTI